MIKNIVFDLSEVLIPGLIGIEERLQRSTGIPKDLLCKALGCHPYYEAGNLLDQLNMGEIAYDTYRDNFLKVAGLPTDYAARFDTECWAMFETPYDYTFELIQKSHKVANLYLISDHCERWATSIVGHYDFFSLFKGLIWSFDIGATKKNALPFTEAIRRFNVDPKESLFIDDSESNIAIAKAHHFNVIHFTGPDSVLEIYRRIGITP